MEKISTPEHRKEKINFALEIAEKIIEKYRNLGDRMDITMLIRDFIELDSFAMKITSDQSEG